MVKATVIYNHPADAAAFEKHYAVAHLPIAAKLRGIARLELTKFSVGPDGGKPAFYRMAELYFRTPQQLQEAFGSPEGKAVIDDLPRFATGGVTLLIGDVAD